MRRVLVTGARGMLGKELLRTAPPDIEAIGVDREEADLAEEGALSGLPDGLDGVIHAAGFTDVAAAETEQERALRDNARATANVARLCVRKELPLIVLSTDFVFDGEAAEPYRESDKTSPLNVYGETKRIAERSATDIHPGGVRIVRTQWLYGDGPNHFPARILERARAGEALRVVTDEFGSPTSTAALAPAVWDVLARGEAGIYHAVCDGFCSRYEFARAVLDLGGFAGYPLGRCTAREFASHVRRPARALLDCSKLARLRGGPLPGWREALVRYLSDRQA